MVKKANKTSCNFPFFLILTDSCKPISVTPQNDRCPFQYTDLRFQVHGLVIEEKCVQQKGNPTR